MNPFQYQRANDVAGAIQRIAPGGKFLAGGTNLVDLMKNGVEKPAMLIDLNRIALGTIEELPDGGVRLGATARNSDTANHPAGTATVSAASEGDSFRRFSATAQPGDQRRQFAAADAVSLFYGRGISAMQ